MSPDPSLLEKLKQIPGCGMFGMHFMGNWYHHEAAKEAYHCEKCAALLVDTLSHQARVEARNEELERTESACAALYQEHYAVIGELCDEHLDRSGALLGRVRDRARALKGGSR